MSIRTENIHPPIPTRSHDWQAWYDGQEEGPSGYGETEQEAVDDLREQIE